ncbi:MAG: hypothetical protein HY556_01405 [Euryarchaeota archaeon]|nr:hypothetical protein [Euryarchaeota archaeon]
MRAFPSLLLAALVAIPGCISNSNFVAATIPDSALATGWIHNPTKDKDDKKDLTVAQILITLRAYERDALPLGSASVATVTKVPIYDVKPVIREQIDKTLEDSGITTTTDRTGVQNVGGNSLAYELFDATLTVNGAKVKGKAVVVQFECTQSSTLVAAVGLAQTEVPASTNLPIGSQGTANDFSTWEALVGTQWQTQLGGMMSNVKCTR